MYLLNEWMHNLTAVISGLLLDLLLFEEEKIKGLRHISGFITWWMKYSNSAVEDVLWSIFVDKRTVALALIVKLLHESMLKHDTFSARLEANVV